jgi:3-deoxy-manno-octulosonate cytidylyltransferase (CMP-KDO synthetase)
MNMNFLIVIPARYGSTRLPGKPLKQILGKPMIQHVYERVIESGVENNNIVIATDHEEIDQVVKGFGGNVVLTSTHHKTGTDRILEVVTGIAEKPDMIINIQGDEPLINPELIKEFITNLKNNKNFDVATLKKKADASHLDSPNIVKVVTDIDNNALYFSRALIPFNRDNVLTTYFKHIGVYAYTYDFLMNLPGLKKSELETAEALEQLRFLENGYKIKVFETGYETIGVDTPDDLERVEKILLGTK